LSLRIADRDCLQRSLLLYRLLSAVGADPELVVGFREQDGNIIGHAWVLVDEVSLVEPQSDLVRFSPVFRFGARGHFSHRCEQVESRRAWRAKPRAISGWFSQKITIFIINL
jgi:hypothetical protein